MSRETTPTTTQTIDHDSEVGSAEWLDDLYNSPSFYGVRHRAAKTYHLLGDEIIDGRMVINPYEGQSVYENAPVDDETGEDYIENPDIAQETARSPKRFARLRKFMGRAAARLNLRVVEAYGAPAWAAEKELQWRNQEKYQEQEGDGWLTRKRKMLGRNAVRIAGGTFASMGASIYAASIYSRVKYSVESLHDHAPQMSIDVRNTPFEYMAKTVFTVGGAGDGGSELATAGGQRMGLYDPATTNIKAHYSASIGPVVGQETLNNSTNEVIPQAIDAYHQANGGKFVIYGFSEGSVAAWKSAEALANSGVDMSNVELIVDGGPLGAMGLGNSQYVGAVNPVLEAMGIDITRGIPDLKGAKITVRSYSGDLWGAGGNDAGVTQLAMAAGLNSHQQVDPSTSYLIKREVINGITYEEWGFKDGPQNPLARALYAQGFYVSPEADKFFDSIAPVTHLGEQTKYANANDVSNAAADLIDSSINMQTGMNTDIARQIEQIIMDQDPARKQDLQNMLQLEQTADRIAKMANDPSTIPTELPIVMNEVRAALQTGKQYMNPNEWIDIVNQGSAAVVPGGMHIPHVEQMQQAAAERQAARGYTPNADPLAQVRATVDAFKAKAEQWQENRPAPAPAPAPANNGQKIGETVTNIWNNWQEKAASNRGNAEVHVETNIPVAPVIPEAPRANADIASNVGVNTTPIPEPGRPLTNLFNGVNNMVDQMKQRAEERRAARANG